MTTGDASAHVRSLAARAGKALRDVPRGIWVGVLIVAVALVATIAAGGFATARTTRAEVRGGELVSTSSYSITVLEAEFTTAVESKFLEAEPGEKFLLMTVRMENLTDRAIGIDRSVDRISANLIGTSRPLLTLHGAEITREARVWRPDGSSGSVILQPSVPSDVVIAWPVPSDAFADGVVALDVHEPSITRGSTILASSVVTWRPDELIARISGPAQDQP